MRLWHPSQSPFEGKRALTKSIRQTRTGRDQKNSKIAIARSSIPADCDPVRVRTFHPREPHPPCADGEPDGGLRPFACEPSTRANPIRLVRMVNQMVSYEPFRSGKLFADQPVQLIEQTNRLWERYDRRRRRSPNDQALVMGAEWGGGAVGVRRGSLPSCAPSAQGGWGRNGGDVQWVVCGAVALRLAFHPHEADGDGDALCAGRAESPLANE